MEACHVVARMTDLTAGRLCPKPSTRATAQSKCPVQPSSLPITLQPREAILTPFLVLWMLQYGSKETKRPRVYYHFHASREGEMRIVLRDDHRRSSRPNLPRLRMAFSFLLSVCDPILLRSRGVHAKRSIRPLWSSCEMCKQYVLLCRVYKNTEPGNALKSNQIKLKRVSATNACISVKAR